MKRNFEKWLSTFRESISSYEYYADFNKIYENVNDIKVELNILNSLIGSKNVENDFINLYSKYPEILKSIPILLAVRENEIYAVDKNGEYKYNFKDANYDIKQYCYFLNKTGLFELISKHIVNNLYDYVTGVETGLDSNGRKNRGGHLMENLVQQYIEKAGYKLGVNYFKEMYIHEIQSKWDVDLSSLSNDGKAEKRFDYVIKGNRYIYGIETNFYASGGSKLNETARSYKQIAQESKGIKKFKFMWFTDGKGWLSAKHNLQETFDVLNDLYNIKDLENNILNEVIK